MQIFKSKKAFEEYRNSIPADKSIGFVPTMGALHEGHLSLFSESIKENDITIGSIFVNPTQFDNASDLEKYPNQIESDLGMLERLGVDTVFTPTIEEMYPEGLQVENIDLHGLDKVMEGAHRPGHFEGMATIVKRLFETVKPNKAYFGQKDYQQLQIIKNLTLDYDFPIQIMGMPIVRETSGLAMSSRNMRLTHEQQDEASVIYKTLMEIKENAKEGERAQELLNRAYKNFAFSNLKLEYCEITDAETLQEVEKLEENKNYRAFIAAYCGDVRLIDNAEIL